MKAYLVGGAVRDQLLGFPVTDRDWVVVGATPERLRQLGYQQVGRDFPVFLHPETREEYALARTERKHAGGYYGFVCDASPHVTLEEDLARRDLTINAIAMDDNGVFIDPYGGIEDLKFKRLRHVSDAFIEDPVRVLRVARFAAKFYHLGFELAEDTQCLMRLMVKQGELAHLVPERVWQEWQRSLTTDNPECFITTLRACGALRVILPEIDALFGVPGSPRHHSEIDSGIHSLLVLKASVAMSPDPKIRFAALLHDLGKATTPVLSWPSHPRHDENGVAIINTLCQRLRIPLDYRHLAEMVSRFHISIHRLYDVTATQIVSILEQMDAFRRPQRLNEVLLVCEADAQPHGMRTDYQQTAGWRLLQSECAKICAKDVMMQGYQGAQIKKVLHLLRVNCVEHILSGWSRHET
jgi:tRNA nucleotidyltransferase (CCA-adding enzyme)